MTARKTIVLTVLSVAILLTFNSLAYASVTAKRYNSVLHQIQNVSGKGLGTRSQPVPFAKYTYRAKQLRSLRRSCRKSSTSVLATWYGGPGDSGTPGHTGYRGDNLIQHPDSFAELSMGSALGGLPHKAKRWIHYGNKSASARKRDIGAGGPRGPKIDLWHTLARRLGFVDGNVTLTIRPCRGVF